MGCVFAMKKSKGESKMGERKKKGTGTKKRTPAMAKQPDPTPATEEPKDFEEVRKNIAALVRTAANAIVTNLIQGANSGQVAPAKYLFEAVGLYPATAETLSKPEDSPAYALFKKLGLRPAGMICEEAPQPVSMTSPEKSGVRGVNRIEESRED